MNFKLKLSLISATILLFLGGDARIAQGQGNKGISSKSETNADPVSGCSPLTTEMIEKVLGQQMRKIMPMYGGAWGCGCTYRGGGVRIDFAFYEETSAADAKHAFDTYSAAADSSSGNPSIGDSAYWVTNAKREPYIYVLKGKVHFSIGMSPPNENKQKEIAGAAASASE